VAGQFERALLSFLYWSLRRLLELVVLRCRSEREKEIEILMLRQQLRVLKRQVAGRRVGAAGDRRVYLGLPLGCLISRSACKWALYGL
jgi:hypothetical protein